MTGNRIAVLMVVLAVGLGAGLPRAAAQATVYIEPVLQETLATATGPLEFIVNYDPLLTSGAGLSSAIQHLGAGTLTYKHLDSVAVLGTAAQIEAITGMSGVTGVYANRSLQLLGAERTVSMNPLHDMPGVATPSGAVSRNLSYIGADRVWQELEVTGNGMGLALLDSGIYALHPDLLLGPKVVQNVKVIPDPAAIYTFLGDEPRPLYLENQNNTDTTFGHGTPVAGIAGGTGAASAGKFAGVAKGANLVGVAIFDPAQYLDLINRDNRDLVIKVGMMLAGFDYIREHAKQYNIKVVNNSWGIQGRAAEYDPKDPVNQGTKKLHDAGITVVFAAGNWGSDWPLEEPRPTVRPDNMNLYALPPWVISVGSGCVPSGFVPVVQKNRTVAYPSCPDADGERGLMADWSSHGVPGDPLFHPTLTAPGDFIVGPAAPSVVGIAGQINGCEVPPHYGCASGTSNAAPHVAGTIALMHEAAGGKLKPDQIKQILEETARPILRADPDGTPYELWEVGAGYLDAYAAVKAAQRYP